jgi:hypothetical protein
MTEHKEACCTSPAAVCYRFTISLVAWGVLSLIGMFWRPLHALPAATMLFAMAIGCVANWLRNRTSLCYHWATIVDRCSGVLAVKRDQDSPQQFLGLAVRCCRSRHRVSTRMAVYEAFRGVTLRVAIARSWRYAIRS